LQGAFGFRKFAVSGERLPQSKLIELGVGIRLNSLALLFDRGLVLPIHQKQVTKQEVAECIVGLEPERRFVVRDRLTRPSGLPFGTPRIRKKASFFKGIARPCV